MKKGYRVTYQSHNGEKNFIGAKDKSQLDDRIKELKSSDHEIIDIEILKAKVYVKNPSEAPSGVKLQEGKRGGHYYESDHIEIGEKPQIKNNIKTIKIDSPEFLKVMTIMNDEEVKESEPISSDYIEKLIKDRKIDLGDTNVNLLPLYMVDAFAFVNPDDPTNIYLSATGDKEINTWVNTLKNDLLSVDYSKDELGFGIDDKRASIIIHEKGHTKVHTFINLKDIKTESEFRETEFEKFEDYVKYLHKYYGVDYNNLYDILDEVLAEDYRQIIGGNQAKIPNRYLFPVDSINSDRYKYKEGRLDILRKMGVF